MITIHDSRDSRCPARGAVDDATKAHDEAMRLGIPEQFRIFLSEPSIHASEALDRALESHQLRLDLADTEHALSESEEESRHLRNELDDARGEADRLSDELLSARDVAESASRTRDNLTEENAILRERIEKAINALEN